ncbi:MAG: DUF3667 domain-containing protein [Prevotella sp.]|nr:DUF3667 domain-containing protein [Prevotella sp.]
MNKEQLRKYYHRFCHWQQAVPHYASRREGEVQHCHNCDNEFEGNFCPICGQRAEVGRVGWKSIKDNIALLWGMDSRSLGYTLLQLLGRPGYLVRDYISGRRQVSFPPVKMLVIVCLFVVVVESVFHVNNDVVGLKFDVQELDAFVGWINSQKSWATLFLQSFYILPTWLVFRYASGYPLHTLPEGFFLQVFLSALSLLTTLFIGYWNEDLDLALWIIYMYITYRQLFDYGWWGTLWRLAVLLQLAVTTMLFAAVIIKSVYDHEDISGILILLALVVVLEATILYVTHRINKRTYRNNKDILSNL